MGWTKHHAEMMEMTQSGFERYGAALERALSKARPNEDRDVIDNLSMRRAQWLTCAALRGHQEQLDL